MKFAINKRAAHDALHRAVQGMNISRQIGIRSGRCGFFSDLIMALNGINYAKRNNLVCEVQWNERSLYHEAGMGPNAWLYYFEESVFDFSVDGAAGGLTAFKLPYYPPGSDPVEGEEENPRAALNVSYGLYARPRQAILDTVDDFMESNFQGAAVVGVHVRGTDAASNFEGRMVQPWLVYLDAVQEWIDQNPGGKIFLATDEAQIVTSFTEKFGAAVVFRDAIRSVDGKSVHGHYDGGQSGGGYRKGLDVLLDALILSRCDFLVRGFSFVTAYSLCRNPDLKFRDLDLENLGVIRTRWLHKGGGRGRDQA